MNFEARAKAINKHMRVGAQTLDSTTNPTSLYEEWNTTVYNYATACEYFKRHYKHYPDQLCMALASHVENVVSGKTPMSEGMKKASNNGVRESYWDFMAEVYAERTKGLVVKSNRQMDELLQSETEVKANSKQHRRSYRNNKYEPTFYVDLCSTYEVVGEITEEYDDHTEESDECMMYSSSSIRSSTKRVYIPNFTTTKTEYEN